MEFKSVHQKGALPPLTGVTSNLCEPETAELDAAEEQRRIDISLEAFESAGNNTRYIKNGFCDVIDV